jgi:Tfp pilus assembly protein PilX
MKKAFLLRRRDGMALVITLSLVVLVTVAAVAFFSRATSNRSIESSRANEVLADQLAQTAAAHVMGQFLQEIAAGSNATTVNGTTIFRPLTPANAVPQRRLVLSSMTSNATFTNLVRQSGPADSAQPDADGTAAPAANGRSITGTAWSKPLLLNGASTTSTPGTFSANNTLPQWIYITRNGTTGNLTTLSANAVVGRFAYNVYDTGGLLDANVAGCPTSVSSNSTLLKEIKDTLAGADLTALLGNSTTAVAAINDLIQFRNPGYASSPADYINYVKDAKKRGFLTINASSGNASSNSTTLNNFFTTRQDLIRYAQSTNSTVLTNALPYLTHYSRALEQPSFIPHPDRPRITPTSQPPPVPAWPPIPTSYQGNNNYAGGDDIINLASGGFLSVRVQSPFTRLNGTAAIPGEPLVKTRFALSNLTRVTTNATASQSPTDPIYARFGISRSNPSEPWTYNHGNPQRILTLSEVSTQNREPDFAELLKSAIHAGSLGKGAVSDATPYNSAHFQYPSDVNADLQILQIMANLIDQAKSDNFPTRIQLNDGNIRTVYGTQNLPYIYSWRYFGVTTQAPVPSIGRHDVLKITAGSNATSTTNGTSPTVGYIYRSTTGTSSNQGLASYLIIPTIWNPHDANSPVSTTGPLRFRVVAETTAPLSAPNHGKYWRMVAGPGISYAAGNRFDGAYKLNDAMRYNSAITNFTAPPISALSTPRELTSADALEFRFSNSTTFASAFREPTLLWRNQTPVGMDLIGYYCTEILSGETYFGIRVADDCKLLWTKNAPPPSGFVMQTPNTPLAGSNTTWSTTNSTTYTFRTSSIGLEMYGQISGPVGTDNEWLTFRMEYWSGTQWIPYQEFQSHSSQWTGYSGFSLPVDGQDFGINGFKNPFLRYPSGTSNATGQSAPELDGSTLTYPIASLHDPRTPRFGAPLQSGIPKHDGNAALDAMTMRNNDPYLANNQEYDAVADSNFVLVPTMRSSADRGESSAYTYSNPSNFGFRSGSNLMGMFSQNVPTTLNDSSGSFSAYYEDADGICRRAAGAYAGNSVTGLPLAVAGSAIIAPGGVSTGQTTPTTQSRSRPVILHRPLKSVAEMSYAFRGTPWKNIDFFTPESGDSALLDVFCVDEPPADSLVAGKVNINSRQPAVLQSLLQGAFVDEWSALPSAQSNYAALPAISPVEASNLANRLLLITSNSTASWRGPLSNISEIVGRHTAGTPPGAASSPDVYQYQNQTFSGFSAMLGDSGLWTSDAIFKTNIQRMREAAIRPLADMTQARVWTFLLDIVAQSGIFPTNSLTAPANTKFLAQSEKRAWIHIAIDRTTGKVIDLQWEFLNES